jgi:hypothetical protein
VAAFGLGRLKLRRSAFAIGVPVKPTKLACGRASGMWRAKPPMKSTGSVGLVGDDDDVPPVRQHGVAIALLGRVNFWMVVKTTPPPATRSFSRRSARSAGLDGRQNGVCLRRE